MCLRLYSDNWLIMSMLTTKNLYYCLIGLSVLISPIFLLIAKAEPRAGISLGAGFTLSPFVEGSVTYDDNIRLAAEGDETEDLFYGLVGGLSLMKSTDGFVSNLRGWYRTRRYKEADDLDDNTWQESFGLVIGDVENLQLKLDQKYSDISDYEFTQSDIGGGSQEDMTLRLIEGRTRRINRVLNDVGASVLHQTEKLHIQAGGGYASVSFDDDSNLNDWSELEAMVGASHETTDKSSITLMGAYGSQDTDNGLQSARFTKIRLGVKSQRSTKVSVNIGGGVQFYQAEDSYGSTEKLDEIVFNYSLNAAWAVTRKVSVHAFGRDEVVPTSAFENNAKRVDQVSLGTLWRPFQDWETSLGASYRADTYLRLINGIDAEETLSGLQFKIGYVPGDHIINVVINLRYEEFESNIQDDYTQFRASLLLNLTY